MRNYTLLPAAPMHDDPPSRAMSSAMRYVIAAWRTQALDDGAAFYNAMSHAKARGHTDDEITDALGSA